MTVGLWAMQFKKDAAYLGKTSSNVLDILCIMNVIKTFEEIRVEGRVGIIHKLSRFMWQQLR